MLQERIVLETILRKAAVHPSKDAAPARDIPAVVGAGLARFFSATLAGVGEAAADLSVLMEHAMPREPNGREPEFSEEDMQREQLGPRGVPGKPSPARMTPQRDKKTPKDVDPGHTA